MPLLEDGQEMQTDMEDGLRPRTSSTGGGIRNFFRKKHKSGPGTPIEDGRMAGSPTTGGSKVKNLFDSIRPRSKSDSQHNTDVPRKRGSPQCRSPLTAQPVPITKQPATPPSYNHGTPMSNLLISGSPQVHHQPFYHSQNQVLLDKFRHRAYSDPKPRAQHAALAARNAVLARQVSLTASSGGAL